MRNKIGWAAFLLVVLSLALNGFALHTILEQEATIGALRIQVQGIVAVQGVAVSTDREIVNVVSELDWQVGSIQAIQDMHAQTLDDLVQNDVATIDILNRLVSLVEQGQ